MAGAEATVFGQPAPNTGSDKQDAQEMAEDIGLLQNTIIRAPFSKLPKPTSWEFYSYFWTLLKARFTAMYTRSHFKRCVHKKGIASYLPVDFMKHKELKNKAKKMYKRYYDALAAYASPLPYSSCAHTRTNQLSVATPNPSETSASHLSRPRCAPRSPPAAPSRCRGNSTNSNLHASSRTAAPRLEATTQTPLTASASYALSRSSSCP